MAEKESGATDEAAGLNIYPASVAAAGEAQYFLTGEKGRKWIGMIGRGGIRGKQMGEIQGKPVMIGPMDHANACAIRQALPWTAPRCLGLATSVGLGDRLGLATPGHIRAVRGTKVAAILAQQSIRQLVRTHRTPDEVMDCATWGVLQEGFAQIAHLGPELDTCHGELALEAFLQVSVQSGILFGIQLEIRRNVDRIGSRLAIGEEHRILLETNLMRYRAHP